MNTTISVLVMIGIGIALLKTGGGDKRKVLRKNGKALLIFNSNRNYKTNR